MSAPGIRCLLCVVGIGLGWPGGPATAAAEVPTPLLLDFGTPESPVAPGANRATAATVYDARRGYGWTSRGMAAFDRDRPLAELRHGGNPTRPDLLYRDHATPLNRDGVASEDDLRFRIDVAPGRYRVQVWLGDLHAPLQSLAVACNGKTVATGVSAKHIVGRGRPESTGLYQILRFEADAERGRIELRFFGDATQYEENRRRYQAWFPEGTRVESYLGSPWDPDRRLKFDPGGPFTRNSVLALRVQRSGDRLVRWRGGELEATETGGRAAGNFVAAFNRGDFAAAEASLDAESTPPLLALRGTLALLGHPAVEGSEEQRLLAKAEKMAAAALEGGSPSVWVREAAESLDLFARGRRRFLERGMAEEGHFQENRKAVSLLRVIRPGDLLYYKALQYQGRALQMLDPHRWVYASGDAQAVWRKLAAAFPRDRYAQFYLHDQWTPDALWHYGDHLRDTEGAPDWAVAQREAWGLLLDVCEWWAANKQHADGSIGGGWGDDVELVALFGLMGSISEDASPESLRLAVDLIEGLWRYGGIDTQAGYYRGLLDAEHSAEWTGDTLPLMLNIDWGNPLWVERATQTARLMRDLWMDRNERGELHFRSNFLGSVAVGDRRQANDSYINCRATFPAQAVYRYNRHPEIARLLVAWADAWLADALRTDRGKPRGVFPAEVGFPRGELGGVDSPNWYTAAHPPGSVNYDWRRGQYYGYLVDLMLLAREITRDDKYLEPFRLQKQLVDACRVEPQPPPRPGSARWAGMLLASGTPRGRQPFDVLWQRVQLATASGPAGEPPVLLDAAEVLKRMNLVRRETKRRWPVLTTETSATDRVGFRGIGEPYFVMTGTRNTHPSVTYSGVGRDFAAFVERSGPRRLTVVAYNFARKETAAAITPWRLDVGATYELTWGSDRDGDGAADGELRRRTVVLRQRGQRVPFDFAPRQATVLELRQTKPGGQTQRYADLAVVPAEIKYSIWTRDLLATVHNVGAAAARGFDVAFYESAGGSAPRRIGRVRVPHLSWPLDLQGQTLRVAVPYVPAHAGTAITVAVDEAERIDELCKSNNQATRRFSFDLDEINAPRNRVGEIGGDLSGEIERGIR